MGQKVVVTGGSGFIGSHLIDALAATGAEVVNVDIAPPPTGQAGTWARVDLMDADALARTVAEAHPEIIYNLAAVADIALPREAMLPNTEGLRNLLDAARTVDPLPRIIHTSTQLVVSPGHVPANDRDYAPYTVYGESKAESEEMMWSEADSFVWTILRPTTIWGPRHPSFARSIWKYINRRWYLLPSGIDPIRSYGFIDTIVAQFLRAGTVDSAEIDRQVFYVGDEPIRSSVWLDGFSHAMTHTDTRRVPGRALRLMASAGQFLSGLGLPAPIDRGRLYRMTTDYPVPMQRTFDVLGHGPRTIAEGIADTVAWLRRTYPAEYER